MATNTHHHERDYRGFCKALKENPSITFRQYCDDIGANATALYRWMQRRHISLKILYKGAGRSFSSSEESDIVPLQEVANGSAGGFLPISVDMSGRAAATEILRGISMTLPSGVHISIDKCPCRSFMSILGGPVMGKADV
ncbi:MAG: hypothetical protein NC402_03355 [Prevotella sp.]|nr:hypothetical protein [Prevotella sp.]